MKKNREIPVPFSRYRFIDFKAVLTKNSNKELALLTAVAGGVCNSIETFQGSRRCGLETELLKLCFEDDDVGGIDMAKHYLYHPKLKSLLIQDQEKKMLIETFCEHNVFVQCKPERDGGVPTATCLAYLNAAMSTGHRFMITYPTAWEGVEVIPVWLALENFKDINHPADMCRHNFVKIHGANWIFCNCKGNDHLLSLNAIHKF